MSEILEQVRQLIEKSGQSRYSIWKAAGIPQQHSVLMEDRGIVTLRWRDCCSTLGMRSKSLSEGSKMASITHDKTNGERFSSRVPTAAGKAVRLGKCDQKTMRRPSGLRLSDLQAAKGMGRHSAPDGGMAQDHRRKTLGQDCARLGSSRPGNQASWSICRQLYSTASRCERRETRTSEKVAGDRETTQRSSARIETCAQSLKAMPMPSCT